MNTPVSLTTIDKSAKNRYKWILCQKIDEGTIYQDPFSSPTIYWAGRSSTWYQPFFSYEEAQNFLYKEFHNILYDR